MAKKSQHCSKNEDPDLDQPPKSSGEKVVLRKEVSLLDCVTFTAGTIVGSGIFISPKGVLQNSGQSVGLSLVVWVSCGVLSIMGALSYAELGTTFPKSGGDFTFLNEGFTPLLAFLRLWTSVVAVRTGAWTVLSMTFAKYILAPFFYGCSDPPIVVERLLAACALCRTENFANSFPGSSSEEVDYTKLPLAIYSALFAYAGWQYLPQITEEMIDANRNLPLGMIISMILVSTVYTLTNVAYFAVLNPKEILASDAVAVDFARRVLGSFWWIIPLGVSVSCVGSINGGLFASSRMLFVASREGHLPKVAAMIHIKRYSPLPAAAVMLPVCLLMLTSNSVFELLNFLSFSRWAFIALAVAIIPYQRWRYPDAPRPFKIPVVIPIMFSFCALFVVVMSLYSAPYECGIGLAITLAGVPIYLVGVRWKNQPDWMVNSSKKSTIFLQKLLLVVLQEEKTC